MDVGHLQQRLWEAARNAPADETVPPGFPRRVMLQLQRRIHHGWTPVLTGHWWRAAAWCSAVAVLVIAMAITIRLRSGPDLEQGFQNALWAAIDTEFEATEVQ